MANQQLPQLSKEEQLIAFFVQQCEGRIGRTHLMKLLYLADYESRRFLGKPITTTTYSWHHYGPYDEALPEHISRLAGADVIRQNEVLFPNGRTGYRYYRGTRDFVSEVAADELMVLKYVCDAYGDVDLTTLLDEIVYETEPMLVAKQNKARGKELDMSVIDGAKRYDFGIGFDELLARSFSARSGNRRPLADVVRTLEQSQAA